MVQGQAFEVYFRDIVACIKALFADAEFSLYLKFVPERQYEDESKREHLYHGMHTGEWWWDTQVCNLCDSC